MPRIPAIPVRQWLPEWDAVQFSQDTPRRKPPTEFFVLSMSALDLKRISGIHRRDPSKPPAEDLGIQRRHMPDRSEEILRYLQDGFPLSRIRKKTLVNPAEEPSLRMPGWIPTAIIANILRADDRRGPKETQIPPQDLVRIERDNGLAHVVIPEHCLSNAWTPIIHPVEIIDGQHRLWALEEPPEGADATLWTSAFKERIRTLEIPVVVFEGLDRTWQAYLFYTINQLPKRIDTSLVFDLYPLLRTEDWLLRFEGPEVYRQSRAQDLTILLWSHPESPWKDRILRLGGRKRGQITQASLIRSLMVSFIRRYKEYQPGTRAIGGLFGASARQHDVELGWVREQQAAFLILIWQAVRDAVNGSNAPWAQKLRAEALATGGENESRRAPFEGEHTLLASDQGCRAILSVMNDMFWLANESDSIDLNSFQWQRRAGQTDDEAVSDALASLRKDLPTVSTLANDISKCLATFEWRLSSAISQNDPQYRELYPVQASYRGSSGYRELRRNVLEHLRSCGTKQIRLDAEVLVGILGFEEDEGSAA